MAHDAHRAYLEYRSTPPTEGVLPEPGRSIDSWFMQNQAPEYLHFSSLRSMYRKIVLVLVQLLCKDVLPVKR